MDKNYTWWKILLIFIIGLTVGGGTLYLIMRADAADARATIARISDELSVARRNTDAALATVAELNDSNTRLENNLIVAKDASAASEARARELQKTLRGTEQELQRANNIVLELTDKNNELRKQIEDLGGTIEGLILRVSQFEDITRADAERISELESRVSGYLTQISELQNRISSYIQQIESIGGDISELGSISSQFNSTIADLTALAQEFSGTSGNLDDILTAIERFVDEGLGRIENLESIDKQLNATVERLKGFSFSDK